MSIGFFEDDDRNSVICTECADQQYEQDDDFTTGDSIPADWDGAEQFRCAKCQRLLVDVAQA